MVGALNNVITVLAVDIKGKLLCLILKVDRSQHSKNL